MIRPIAIAILAAAFSDWLLSFLWHSGRLHLPSRAWLHTALVSGSIHPRHARGHRPGCVYSFPRISLLRLHTKLLDDDIRALYAYLMIRPPVRATVPPNTIPFPVTIPRFEVEFLPSTEAPVGPGEPATTVVAPTIGNATLPPRAHAAIIWQSGWKPCCKRSRTGCD